MSRQKVNLRVIKGALVPADDEAREILRSRGFSTGDTVQADLVKVRNPKFNKLVHAIGRLCVDNLAQFDGLDGHGALKRLQLEGNIACDEKVIDYPTIGKCLVRMPRSLSFAEMDEGEFRVVARDMCRLIAERYWVEMTAEQVEDMLTMMVNE